jgi:hypothetical protein
VDGTEVRHGDRSTFVVHADLTFVDDGMHVVVGGHCTQHFALGSFTARETAHTVTITLVANVTPAKPTPGTCHPVYVTAKARLSHAIGSRAVIDGQSGQQATEWTPIHGPRREFGTPTLT